MGNKYEKAIGWKPRASTKLRSHYFNGSENSLCGDSVIYISEIPNLKLSIPALKCIACYNRFLELKKRS